MRHGIEAEEEIIFGHLLDGPVGLRKNNRREVERREGNMSE